MLPLGKLDPGLRAADSPLDLGRVAEDARRVEDLGYDGLAVEETRVDPYVVMALRLPSGTSSSRAAPVAGLVTATGLGYSPPGATRGARVAE